MKTLSSSSLTSCYFLLALLAASLAPAQEGASDQPKSDDGSLLPQMVEIARKDGDKFYNITEIYNGVARTETIREAARCHNCYSVAKLFTVVTLGIMEDQGLLDIDEPIYPILKDEFPEDFDPKWRDVTINDVLRHRAGYGKAGFLDIDAENSANWKERDFLKIALGEKLQYKPGEKFVYTDAVFYLASCIATAKSGEKLSDLMIRNLLEPLEFAEYAFSTDPQGRAIGATGLYIGTDDMAKLGQLLVQDGVYNGKQIVSKKFVDKAFQRNLELYPVGSEGVAFGKGGMNGQYLYMNRKTKRVVALHSYGGNVDAIVKFLAENDK